MHGRNEKPSRYGTEMALSSSSHGPYPQGLRVGNRNKRGVTGPSIGVRREFKQASTITSSGCPIGISAAPSSTRILAITPSSELSNAMVACSPHSERVRVRRGAARTRLVRLDLAKDVASRHLLPGLDLPRHNGACAAAQRGTGVRVWCAAPSAPCVMVGESAGRPITWWSG